MNPRTMEVMIIFLISFIFAGVFNAFSSTGLPFTYQYKAPEFVSGEVVPLKKAKLMHEDTSVVFIDARSARYYQREHIPGAINIPYNTKELEKLTSPFKKSQKFVVYCYSESCNMARLLSDLLTKNGFESTALFDEGISAWKAAEYPTIKTDE